MTDPEFSYEFIQKNAALHPDVLKQLQVIANRIKGRAETLAKQDGVEMTVTTKAGVRPGGRPYVNVIGDNPDQEYGSSRSGKFRILGRAGEGG